MATCQCVLCDLCHGTGTMRVETDGWPEFELETCEECRGSGISQTCDSCQDDAEMDRDDLAS